jgi:hypothetical protein
MAISAELRSYLEGLLERARLSELSYRDFLHILIMSSCPHRFNRVRSHKVLEVVRGLVDAVSRAPDNLVDMRHQIDQLVRKGYKPFLVDCLGLPEVYEVYARISEECGVLAPLVKPYINGLGVTQRFKEVHETSTMAELARILGTSIYKSIDKEIHGEFSKPMELNNLLDMAEAKLRSVARGLAKDALKSMKAVIISDHGYDSYCDDLGRYHLGHGDESRLAKIAPLIIIEC